MHASTQLRERGENPSHFISFTNKKGGMIFCEMYRDESFSQMYRDESFSQMFFALNDNKFRSMENYKEGQVSAVLKFSIVQTTKRTPKICVIVKRVPVSALLSDFCFLKSFSNIVTCLVVVHLQYFL